MNVQASLHARQPLRLVLFGAGQRGRDIHGEAVLREGVTLARFVAVVDPDPAARDRFGARHQLPEVDRHASVSAFLAAAGTEWDAAIIATPDREHVEPALAVMAAGRPMLLEKPVAVSEMELDRLLAGVRAHAGDVTVAHPLRYTPFFTTLHDLVRRGEIGRLMAIDHVEDVGYWHFAHSFVRGNWRRADLASPFILAKACHDLDLIAHLADSRAVSVTSMGALGHFRAADAPPGAPAMCLDGCPAEASCPFHAGRFYGGLGTAWGWPVSVLAPSGDPADLERALREGPYGRCVYRCDNDVPDHQAALITFANGVVATLTATAFSAEITRIVTLRGTRGEIRGDLERGEIEVYAFSAEGPRAPRFRRMPVEPDPGHELGDERLMAAFLAHVAERRTGAAPATPTALDAAVHGHVLAFAAERARLTGSVIQLGTSGGDGDA